jgi:DNA phosphorothioation-dependent restriction protein DptG
MPALRRRHKDTLQSQFEQTSVVDRSPTGRPCYDILLDWCRWYDNRSKVSELGSRDCRHAFGHGFELSDRLLAEQDRREGADCGDTEDRTEKDCR